MLGPVLYLFESARSYIEERKEAFDARFGTDTAAPSFGRGQAPGAYFYVATTASVIYEILNSLALQADTFAFVDMGSGKGRALLVASEFAFAKIVGIELSSHLHRIAQENIKRYSPAAQQCTDFELHCMDVVEYDYGPEPPVLFLFDPFGRETMRNVVANLEASLSRKSSRRFCGLRLSAVRGCVAGLRCPSKGGRRRPPVAALEPVCGLRGVRSRAEHISPQIAADVRGAATCLTMQYCDLGG